ncbi:MAG: endonuclease/exonuclease/phosphatase family protein [Sulfurimonas sp.]|jgi:endonuclease/exonuclease/phosphatase family metal-dependent hydrolase
MKILVIFLLLFSFVFGDKVLTVASYNVENLFDLENDGYEYDEYLPNYYSEWNEKNYKIKLQNISKVIKDINADIIAIEEIESLRALIDLRLMLQRDGVYYQYYQISDKKNTTTKVAFLSKIPFVYAKEVSVTSSLSQRNILEVKFLINNRDLYLFVNHWKAKTGPESQRIVSAKALQNRVQELGYDKNIILLGDFNSDYEEYKRFERDRKLNDTNGKTAINHILKTTYQTQKADKTKYEEGSFYNLWYDTDEENRYSYIFKNQKEAIDNILISQSLLGKKNLYYQNGTMSSFKPNYLFNGNQIYSWQTTKKRPIKHQGKGFSDHLPVVAKFVITN